MQSFSGATILVVGGAGFVGSNLVRLLLEQAPARVLIVDNLLSAESRMCRMMRGSNSFRDPSPMTPCSRVAARPGLCLSSGLLPRQPIVDR